MDTLTHALSGALLARAAHRPRSGLSVRDRTLAGFVAASFPDLDYLLFWIAPLDFLNEHRGPTHSLLLLPLWALLIAALLSRLARNRVSWRDYFGICALGIGIHVAGDIITIYGTKVLAPLLDKSLALNLIFDLDPYMAIIIGIGFLVSVRWRPGVTAIITGIVVMGYLFLQTAMQGRAAELGERFAAQRDLKGAQVYALPQPFSPFTWKLIVVYEDSYWVTYVNYLARKAVVGSQATGLPWRMIAAYQPPHALHWGDYYRFGETNATQAIARQVWQQERFAAFRRFAKLPALYRVDQTRTGAVCVWFTDLRHNFPVLPPSFRYGMCRFHPGDDWRLYRLRYFRVNDRQLLE